MILRKLSGPLLACSILCASPWSGHSQTINTSAISGSPFAPGASVTVPYTISGSFSGGNTFTAQLSDASGSFSSPTTIGTASTTASGSVAATIPTNLSPASGYRIRVTGSTPAVTGSDNGSNLTLGHNSLAFNGANSYLTLPASFNSNFASNHISIEGWFYVNATNGEPIMLAGESFLGDGNIKFMLYTLGSTLYAGFYNGAFQQVSTSFSTGGWMHVAGTYNQQAIKLYVNGSLVSSTNISIPLPNGTEEWRFGRRWDFSQNLNGRMDDLSIWNRALCQSEIQAHMAGELPNPGSQAGLVAYFNFDQGTPSGTNTTISSVTDVSGNGNHATFNNFALTGSASNFVIGASTVTGIASAYVPGHITAIDEVVTTNISGSMSVNGCGGLGMLTPTGTTTQLSGKVTMRTVIDGSVSSFGGNAYVQRHYEILPATNPNTATADVKLYFTQAEFTAFNAARGSLPSLPVDGTDAANNRNNLRISQFHGVPSGGYAPWNYPRTWGGSGPARVLLTPTAVVYNSTKSIWEVTVPVTGFSGFFASTNSVAPLPLTLISFSASRMQEGVALHWSIAQQQVSNFVVERSGDGQSFSELMAFAASGRTGTYDAIDREPLSGANIYRLRIEGRDGSSTYSNVQRVEWSKSDAYFRFSPVPATNVLSLETNDQNLLGSEVVLMDVTGAKVRSTVLREGKTSLSLLDLPTGVYTLRLADGRCYRVSKQ